MCFRLYAYEDCEKIGKYKLDFEETPGRKQKSKIYENRKSSTNQYKPRRREDLSELSINDKLSQSALNPKQDKRKSECMIF